MKWYRFHNLDSFEVIQSHPKFIFNLKGHIIMWLFNSHKKWSEINIRSSWSRFEHCSESLIYPLGSHTCSLFAPFHMESWPKVKLGSHYVPLLGFIYSYFAPNIPFGSRFRLVSLYFPIFSLFTYIYPHLALFAPIWLYLPLIADCIAVQNLKAIRK